VAAASDPAFLALHGVRVRGVGQADSVAEATGLAVEPVERALRDAAAEGFVVCRTGALPGWQLTGAGRQRHAQLVADELDDAGVRAEVERCYDEFLALNGELLAVCSAWHVVGEGDDRRANDHSDAAYDRSIIARLLELHRRAQTVCASLAAVLERFAPYGRRLDEACRRVAAGEHDWITKPLLASYHTVWFELHEDLLLTLGRERATETQASA
jgi:hypothetical protein